MKMITCTRRYLDLSEPDFANLEPREIAHPLSLICRFGGHTPQHYSVAQHSVIASTIVRSDRPDLQLGALLHDAAEAYLGDLIRPIKWLLRQAVDGRGGIYPSHEAMFRRLIYDWAMGAERRLHVLDHPDIAEADEIMLATEARDFFGVDAFDWGIQAQPLVVSIEPAPARVAEEMWLERFTKLSAAVAALPGGAGDREAC